MNYEAMAKEAQAIKIQSLEAYDSGDFKKGALLEKEYLTKRLFVINEATKEVQRQKSISTKELKEIVRNKPKVERRATGIEPLDRNLVKKYGFGNIGGFALGNFVQIVGSKGAGKSTLLLKILTNFSIYEKVSWFDFEMGEDRVIEKLEDFIYNENNLLYYNSSRELNDVVDEIIFLNVLGINHFVIDSTMKITVTGADKYDRNSLISARFSELTSTHRINIYLINQMSQNSEKEGDMHIKHGNDAEYDADIILFIMKLKKTVPQGTQRKVLLDEYGGIIYDETKRIIKCTKNRQDDRTFTVEIDKGEIIAPKPIEIEFKRDNND